MADGWSFSLLKVGNIHSGRSLSFHSLKAKSALVTSS